MESMNGEERVDYYGLMSEIVYEDIVESFGDPGAPYEARILSQYKQR
jgi:hypothetical protein